MKHKIYYYNAIFASIIFGTTGIFVKKLNLHPTLMTFLRMCIPILLASFILIKKRSNIFKRKTKLMFTASFLNAIRMILYFIGFTYASIGNAVIILYTWPIFATIFSAIYLKEKINKKMLISFLSAFSGIILVYLNKEISFSSNDFLGMSAMLLSAIIFSITFVIFKIESQTFNQIETVFFQNIIGVFIFLPSIFIFPTSIIKLSIGSGYGFLIGVIGFYLLIGALQKLKASTTSFLTYTEVISALILSLIFLNETISWNMVLGAIFIIAPKILVISDAKNN